MRLSDYINCVMRAFACVTAAAFGVTHAAADPGGPARVVSINLCTDQLALMLADDGQLMSVSRLAHDPESSAMVDAARALPPNGSGAEEVFLLEPDLVLAGTFTAPATINLLRDLGIKVETFAPAVSLADVSERMRQMGRVLGREARAQAMIDRFHRDLADLTDGPDGKRPRAAIVYVNSYSSGSGTLAGDILEAAGFDNVADEIGLTSIGRLNLEDLVMLAPDVIIQGRNYPGAARAEDNLNHAALRALKSTYLAGEITDRDWICGTPQVLSAVRAMRDLRLELADRP